MFDELNRLKLMDFSIASFGPTAEADDVLEIHASNSVYHVAASVHFFDVEYLSVSTRFHHALFRFGRQDEVSAVRALADFEGDLFAIEVDTTDRPLFVAASSTLVTIAAPNTTVV